MILIWSKSKKTDWATAATARSHPAIPDEQPGIAILRRSGTSPSGDPKNGTNKTKFRSMAKHLRSTATHFSTSSFSRKVTLCFRDSARQSLASPWRSPVGSLPCWWTLFTLIFTQQLCKISIFTRCLSCQNTFPCFFPRHGLINAANKKDSFCDRGAVAQLASTFWLVLLLAYSWSFSKASTSPFQSQKHPKWLSPNQKTKRDLFQATKSCWRWPQSNKPPSPASMWRPGAASLT